MSLSVAGALLTLALAQTSTPAATASASAASSSGPAASSPAAPGAKPPPATSSTSSELGAEQAAKPAAAAEPRYPEFGLSLDAAAPAGVTLAFVYRPVPFVRLWAGPAWNYLAFGGEGGVGLAPFQGAVTPVLSLEAGRYRSANVKGKFGIKSGTSGNDPSVLLEDVTVSYGSLLLGLEMGSPRGFSFGLRVGLSRLWLKMGRTATFSSDQNGQPTTLTLVEPTAGGVAPALKFGFTYWF